MKLYTKNDWLFALAATLIVLLFGSLSLTQGIYPWGDDCAAYISEGIAIADGRLAEQAQLNLFYHPSPLPQEAFDSGSLVYVWGYPLLLSVVYKLVGFGADKIIFFKIPLLLSLALTAGALVLLFRKRLSIFFSFILSIVFCLSSYLFGALNQLYSDLPFVFFCILSMLLMECICDLEEKGRSVIGLGIVYAFSLWFTYETRLSGISVCVLALIEHAVVLISLIKKSVNRKKMILQHVFPYVLFGVLVLISERIWFLPATNNYSDLSVQHDKYALFIYYFNMIKNYFRIISGESYILLVLFLIGLIRTGFQKKNMYLTVLLIGTFIVNINLPYAQGPRYIYNVLPFILLYSANGMVWLADIIKKFSKNFLTKIKNESVKKKLPLLMPKICKAFIVVLLAWVLFNVCTYSVRSIYSNITNWGQTKKEDAYSSYAKEVYQYISENTDTDSVICFEKPRMLYLNTGRKSFRYGINGHELSEADYYLKYKNGFTGELKVEIPDNEVVLDNEMFVLYSLNK